MIHKHRTEGREKREWGDEEWGGRGRERKREREKVPLCYFLKIREVL